MKHRKLWVFLALCGTSLTLLLSSFWSVPLPERLAHRDSQTVLWNNGDLAHTFLSSDERWRLPGAAGRVDPDYLKALYFIEDERFNQHFGVDPIAIARAAATNWSRGRIVSGASTLTMQLARLLEPRPRRLSSKIIEAWRALQLHVRLGRQKVLSNYLRFLPFGGNLEGVHGASFAYFSHSAETLDAAEIATLLAVPQRPGARAPTLRNTVRLRSARNAILQRMHQGQLIDRNTLEESIAQPVPEKRRAMPRRVPHAARWLRAQRPFDLEIHSSLDPSAQTLVQEVFDRNAPERSKLAIRNGAIVVVDHHTRQLKALISGANFFADHDGAQIPAFDRPRHAASTLKPLLLGMAIDKGLASPEHLVQDLPTHYGSYRPQNFSGQFQGLVRLDEALTQSLNVPFVRLLSRLGTEQFIGHLRSLGLQHIQAKPDFYGLDAALGTIPVTLIELSEMYAALASDGQIRTLRRFADEPSDSGIKMITAEAAWLLRKTLRKRDRPDFPIRARLYGMAPQIHWKTGTSFGFHDAWSVGSDERHTVAVWLGNLNRDASRYLVGAPIAGPLLFDAFDALGHQDSERLEDEIPGGMMKTEVCQFSGYLPGPGCTETQTIDAPRQSIAIAKCPYHQRLYVVDGEQQAYPKACAPKEAAEQSVLILPSQARSFSSLLLPQAYTLSSNCQPAQRNRLRITSPSQNTLILIPGMDTKEQEIALQAEAAEGAELSWFINGRFLGSRKASEPLWWQPELGEYTIVASDSNGRSTRKVVKVQAH